MPYGRRYRPRFGGARSPKKNFHYVWQAAYDDDNAMAPGAVGNVDLTLNSFLTDATLEPLLVGIRGIWGCAFDNGNSIGANYHKSVFGHAMVVYRPGGPTASAPSDINGSELSNEGVLWHSQGGQTRDYNFQNQTTNTTLLAFFGGLDFHESFRIKARRRFRNEGDRLYFVIKNSGLSTAQMPFQIRVLWRLPG